VGFASEFFSSGGSEYHVLPKQKFIDGLQHEPVRRTAEFDYGPSIALDAIDVKGAPYLVKPFDPAHVSYFSGTRIGIGHSKLFRHNPSSFSVICEDGS